jgi:hypothetical protein
MWPESTRKRQVREQGVIKYRVSISFDPCGAFYRHAWTKMGHMNLHGPKFNMIIVHELKYSNMFKGVYLCIIKVRSHFTPWCFSLTWISEISMPSRWQEASGAYQRRRGRGRCRCCLPFKSLSTDSLYTNGGYYSILRKREKHISKKVCRHIQKPAYFPTMVAIFAVMVVLQHIQTSKLRRTDVPPGWRFHS